MVETFSIHYWNDGCPHKSTKHNFQSDIQDGVINEKIISCEPNVAFLSLILMLGTLWLGVTLYNFTQTPFLSKVISKNSFSSRWFHSRVKARS